MFFHPKAWTPISALTILVRGKINLKLPCQLGLRGFAQCLELGLARSLAKAFPLGTFPLSTSYLIL